MNEIQNSAIETFNIVCDNYCKYSDMNTGKQCAETDNCPFNELLGYAFKESRGSDEKSEKLMISAFAAIICTVHDIKASIPLANNNYVQTGYEITLDILKTNLEKFGIDASFIEEAENEKEGKDD